MSPFWAHASHFGPSKVTKYLGRGLFCNEKWVKNGSKRWFSKKKTTSQTIWGAQTSEMSPLVAQKQAILPSPDSQNALEMGCFGTKNQSKMDQKRCFSKDTFGLFGFHKQVDWSHFEPMLSNFGPSQGRKGLENGLICNHKWLKNGSKPWFPQIDPSPVVVPKRMNASHFEPLLSCSHPLSSPYLIY